MSVLEKVTETRTFIEECWTELQKVTWPDADQLRNALQQFVALVAHVGDVLASIRRRLLAEFYQLLC